jgi:putative MATE family efflux protein
MGINQIKAKDTTKKMTEGPPLRLILGFAVPLFLSFLLQQLYGIVDMIVVGRFIGVKALAGVGASGSINFLIIGLCIGICSGFAIPVAQKFGAGDYVMMRRFIANGVWLAVIFAIIITAVTVAFCDNILLMMNTPADIYEYSNTYIFIIFCGIPTFFLYNLLASVMRALGDSRTPLKILAVSSVISLILNIIFVVGFGSGVAGVAVATVISQFLSGWMCLFFLLRKFPILHIKKEEWQWQTPLALSLCAAGIPMGAQYSIVAIGSVILQSSVNTLGSGAVAAVTAAVRINVFFHCPVDALGSSMATYGGQNVGAGRLERLDKGLKASVKLGIFYSLAAAAIIWIFGRQLLTLFVAASEIQILKDAYLFMRIGTIFYINLSLVTIYRFLIQGMGFGYVAIFAGICEMFARAISGIILVPVFGFIGAAIAGPFAWILAGLFLIPAYKHCKKKLKRQIVLVT